MKNKVKLISFSITFILLASLITPKAYALYQGKSLMREGDNLLASNQYQPALEKYQQSKEKWENKNINEKIEKAKRLIESNENYQKGNEAIENEQWDEAIKKLSRVNHAHEHYQEALQLIKYATSEKQNQKKVAPDVQGVSTTVSTIPKPTISPVEEINIPEPSKQAPTIVEKERVELTGGHFVLCESSKANEIRNAQIDVEDALQEFANCGFDCVDKKEECRRECIDKKKENNWNHATTQLCIDTCNLTDCILACGNKSKRVDTYSDMLNSLINQYCK